MAAPTGSTVVVACKHPPGIIMQVYRREEYDVPVLGGGTRKESRAVAVGKSIKIHGPAVPFGQTPAFVISGGYALTANVPAELAQKWLEQNKESDLVKNDVLFIAGSSESAEKQAKEQKSVRSGLERLDVGTTHKNGREVPRDPRWPARVNPNLSGVQTDKRDEAA